MRHSLKIVDEGPDVSQLNDIDVIPHQGHDEVKTCQSLILTNFHCILEDADEAFSADSGIFSGVEKEEKFMKKVFENGKNTPSLSYGGNVIGRTPVSLYW